MTGFSRWYVNGESLDTCAYNISDRANTWTTAPKRGDNLRVPSRHGSIRNTEKVYDQGSMVLNMWAAGADLQGNMQANARELVRDYLDKLTRLFITGDTLELVRTDNDQVNYGLQNLLPNPSFEDADGKEVVAENLVINPSAEYSEGTAIIRENLMLDPSMEGSDAGVRRTNYGLNPQFSMEGHPQALRSNLAPNPSFETSLQSWAVVADSCFMARIRRTLGDSTRR